MIEIEDRAPEARANDRPGGTVSAVTMRDWVRTHLEFGDAGWWGPPPAAVARLVRQLVDLVGQAHERGLAVRGLDPDAVLVTGAGDVRLAGPAGPGSAADRAADLLDLSAVLFHLATGIPLEPARDGPGLRRRHDRVAARLVRLSDGNPCTAGLAPVVQALLHPDPARRPHPAALRMVLTGRPPRTGTVQVRLA